MFLFMSGGIENHLTFEIPLVSERIVALLDGIFSARDGCIIGCLFRAKLMEIPLEITFRSSRLNFISCRSHAVQNNTVSFLPRIEIQNSFASYRALLP